MSEGKKARKYEVCFVHGLGNFWALRDCAEFRDQVFGVVVNLSILLSSVVALASAFPGEYFSISSY